MFSSYALCCTCLFLSVQSYPWFLPRSKLLPLSLPSCTWTDLFFLHSRAVGCIKEREMGWEGGLSVWYVGSFLVSFLKIIFFSLFFIIHIFLEPKSVVLGTVEKDIFALFFLLYFCFLCQVSLDTSSDWHQLHAGALLAHPFVVTLLLCVMTPLFLPISVLCFSLLLLYQISLVISSADRMLRILKQLLSRCAWTNWPPYCS